MHPPRNVVIDTATPFGRGISDISLEDKQITDGERGGLKPKAARERSIDETYFVDYSRSIGQGCGTVVRKGMDCKTGTRYAVKSIAKSQVNRRQVENLKNEAVVMRLLDHPNILKFHKKYENDKCIHLVTELCNGGDLYDATISKAKSKAGKNKTDAKPGPLAYSERDAAGIVRQLLSALSHCHGRNIVHRDIKPENVLLRSKHMLRGGAIPEVCLIDFGLATVHDPLRQVPMTNRVGTSHYVAPEVLQQEYTNKCDIFSLGVLTFTLLSAKLPFAEPENDDNSDDDNCSIESGKTHVSAVHIRRSFPVQFPSEDWDGVSETAKDFLRAMLEKNPEQRPSAEELLEHKWIQETCACGNVMDGNVSSAEKGRSASILKKLRRVVHMKPMGHCASTIALTKASTTNQ